MKGTISEQLRECGSLGNNIHAPWPRKDLYEAADTIDALVAALEKIQKRAAGPEFALDMDETIEDFRRDLRHIESTAAAALAKARKGG